MRYTLTGPVIIGLSAAASVLGSALGALAAVLVNRRTRRGVTR